MRLNSSDPAGKMARQQRIPRQRTPQRSCVVCRQVKNKRDLIRLVRNDDEVSIDAKGKIPGRGAYLCNSIECWEAALKKNRLEQVLRIKLSPAFQEQLVEYIKSMSRQGNVEE